MTCSASRPRPRALTSRKPTTSGRGSCTPIRTAATPRHTPTSRRLTLTLTQTLTLTPTPPPTLNLTLTLSLTAAHSHLQAVGEAYQVLSSEELRATYDKEGKKALDQHALVDPSHSNPKPKPKPKPQPSPRP